MMLRRLMLVLAVMTLGSGFLVVAAPAQAQTGDCWEVIDDGSFNEPTGFFEYVALAALGLDPGDKILLEITSNTGINEVSGGWFNIADGSGDSVFFSSYPTGPTTFQHIFDTSNPEFGIPMQSSGFVLFGFDVYNDSGAPLVGTFKIAVHSVGCVDDGTGTTGATGGLQDGRLCLWPDFAVYTDGDSIDVYGIRDGGGFLVTSISQRELDANPGSPDTNTLVKQQGRVNIYRLGDTDTFEVHVGPYVQGMAKFVRFTGLPAGEAYCGIVQ